MKDNPIGIIFIFLSIFIILFLMYKNEKGLHERLLYVEERR